MLAKRISSGTRPTLASVFLSSLAVIPLVESDSSLEAAALQHLYPVLDGLQADRHLEQHADGLLLRFGLLKQAEAQETRISHQS